MEEFKNDLAALIKQAVDEGLDADEIVAALKEAANELEADDTAAEDEAKDKDED